MIPTALLQAHAAAARRREEDRTGGGPVATCELCETHPARGYLCPGCEADTAERLERLPELFEEVADLAIPARSTDGTRRGSRPTHAPTPDLEPLAIRWEFGTLPSWHRALAEDSGWPRAESGFALRGEDARILGACIALRASMPWIAREWPAAGDLAREVKRLFAEVRSVTGVPDLPARMGLCPARPGGVLCGAVLRLPHGEKVLRCEWCAATYPPGTWIALKTQQRRVWPEQAGVAA